MHPDESGVWQGVHVSSVRGVIRETGEVVIHAHTVHCVPVMPLKGGLKSVERPGCSVAVPCSNTASWSHGPPSDSRRIFMLRRWRVLAVGAARAVIACKQGRERLGNRRRQRMGLLFPLQCCCAWARHGIGMLLFKLALAAAP